MTCVSAYLGTQNLVTASRENRNVSRLTVGPQLENKLERGERAIDVEMLGCDLQSHRPLAPLTMLHR